MHFIKNALTFACMEKLLIDCGSDKPDRVNDNSEAILNYLKSYGSSIAWLARQINIDRGYLSKMLNKKYPMSEKILGRIIEALKETNFKTPHEN